jgi:hypothetical protein
MNCRMQLSPVVGSRESEIDLLSTEQWHGLSEFVRSWPDLQTECDERRGNTALGLALALGISGGFWVGVGLLIAHFWA